MNKFYVNDKVVAFTIFDWYSWKLITTDWLFVQDYGSIYNISEDNCMS